MVTLEHMLILGLSIIVLTILTVLQIGVVDFVDENVRLLLGD